MRTVLHNAKILIDHPYDYAARAEIMWAGSLAHNGLTGCGRTGDWASHQLEHELSGMFDVAHGAGLAAIWSSWARYVYQTDAERFARFAVQVMGISEQSQTQEELALEGISAMERFYHQIGMPVSISELGVLLTEEQCRQLAYHCSFEGTRSIGGFRTLDQFDMEQIYKSAR